MRLLIALLLLTLLPSCSADGETLLQDAHAAMAWGDYESARAKFTAALQRLSSGHPRYIEARLGVIETLIAEEPERAGEAFSDLAASFPDRIGDRELSFICSQMISAARIREATQLMNRQRVMVGDASARRTLAIERIEAQIARDDALYSRLMSTNCWGPKEP